jgi:hypothetical protein
MFLLIVVCVCVGLAHLGWKAIFFLLSSPWQLFTFSFFSSSPHFLFISSSYYSTILLLLCSQYVQYVQRKRTIPGAETDCQTGVVEAGAELSFVCIFYLHVRVETYPCHRRRRRRRRWQNKRRSLEKRTQADSLCVFVTCE